MRLYVVEEYMCSNMVLTGHFELVVQAVYHYNSIFHFLFLQFI